MDSSTRSYDAWIGHDVYDTEGDKIGKIDDIFYDDVTQRPEWLAVKTGLFGSNRTFVPIQGASVCGDDDQDLQVSFTKEHIKAAPNIDPEGTMTASEEKTLWQHYGYDYDTTTKTSGYGYGKSYATGVRADRDYDPGWRQDWKRGDQPRTAERESEVIAEATATNETVVKQTQPETVRLRKYVWTENVPVQREEVRVEGESTGKSTTSGTTQTQSRPRNA